MKIIVIGLDGASFELIDPWIEQGELPNLKKIKENGVWGDMKSCLPPVTAPNWKCYSTGKNPGKLGIYFWETIDCENKKIYFPRSRIYKNKEIWDYIGEKGKRVGVLNMPTTYPPKRVNGFMVSGSADAEDENFTYPADLESNLKKNYNYKVHPVLISFIEKDSEKSAEEMIEIIESRFEVAKNLLEKENLDFFHITIFYINILHHFFWDNESVKKAWKIIDMNIGELTQKEYNIIIMSDHGSNEIKQEFYINTWLEKDGYLKLNKIKNFSSFLHKLRINQGKLSRLTHTLHIKKLLQRIISEKIVGIIPTEDGVIRAKYKADKIDWDKTKVLASGQGPIYINLDKNTKEYENLRNKLIKRLENLKNPFTNEKVVDKVYKKEEIYSGEYLKEAPDLIMDQAKSVHIPDDIGKKDTFDSPKKWKAENKKIGLFMAYGPDIKKDEKIKDVSILDLAPTILHMMNIPVPDDMDGKVLREIFKENSESVKRQVVYQKILEDKTKREKEKIKEAIRRLKI